LDSNWVALFNGKDLANWHSYIAAPGYPERRYENPADDPAKSYRIVNGEIVYTASSTVNQTMGYLATDSLYSRYQFRVEYKFGPTCAKGVSYCKNSGLLYHMVKDGIFGTGIECNLYWDWPTATAGLGGVKFTKERPNFGNFQSEADKMNQYTTDGEWNIMEVRVWGDSGAEHYVNGHLGGWVVGIKLADGTPLTKGAVALQIEGNDVSFRNPKIRDLGKRVDTLGCTDMKSANFNPKATKDDGTCAPAGNLAHARPAEPFNLQAGRLILKAKGAYFVEVSDTRGKLVFSRFFNQPGSLDFRKVLSHGGYFVKIRSASVLKPHHFPTQKLVVAQD